VEYFILYKRNMKDEIYPGVKEISVYKVTHKVALLDISV